MRVRVPAILAAAVLSAAGPAAAATPRWLTFGYDTQRTGFDPVASTLGAANASTLAPLWTARVDGVIDAQPVYDVADDVVVAATEHGVLYALRGATGAVLWKASLGHVRPPDCHDLPGDVYGISSAPVVDTANGVVYAVAGDDRLHARSLATGRELPGWPVSLGVDRITHHVWGALNARGSTIVVPVGGYCNAHFYRGQIIEVAAKTARVTHRIVLARGRWRGAGIWGWGGVALDGAGAVFAATANSQNRKQDGGLGEHLLRLSPALALQAADRPPFRGSVDEDFGAQPLLIDAPGCPGQLVVMHKTGVLYLYDRAHVGGGPQQALQVADPHVLSSVGTYSYAPPARTLYVVSQTSGKAPYDHGLNALRLGADCRLHPRWHAPLDPDGLLPAVPIVSGGVVYAVAGQTAYARDAAGGGPLWSSGRAIDAPIVAAPMAGGGRLYLGGWDGRLRAFAPTGA